MMILGRRAMLGGMAGAAALAMTGGVAGAANRRLKRFGVQLYSLREVARADPIGTLRRVKALGYSEVELGGPPYSAMDPATLRRELTRIGLTAPSMHVQMNELEADAPKVFAQAQALGCTYAVLPYLAEDRRSTIAQCQMAAAQMSRFGAQAKAAGVVFAYHNHSFEFEPVEGMRPFDIFFDNSDPALVKIELDIFWAAKAKADVPAIMAKYAGRIPLCHVKDMSPDGSMTDVGAGTIDFAQFFALPGSAGLVHYFVEHDEPPAPYWPSISASAKHMKALRY